ncbi:HEPN domain-containing protein [Neolewinella lacunae]|uniref:Apea-like HEPN domain-containing protein n=1 Tax=Neolewinella lacunae TaxID=1517758 RepID=A0A923T9X4_9BACT|nr:HEPN domain-containing protein [Neolewinella lacunae]MBC6995533.1 hypothetical protein [Neolewinella lacunae]MDN3635121.1 HEPN domain-containing protein [Neolewinella lacunae]
MKVEYQIVIDQTGDVCTSIDSLKALLQLNEKITIKDNSIEFENSTFDIDVKDHLVSNRNQIVYTVSFNTRKKEDIEIFSCFLKLVRSLILKIALSVSVLWDDISLYYSERAYPEIWKSENLLRKLIYKFMVETVGQNWTDENLPEDFRSSISNTKINNRTASLNILHKADFIQLSEFLFKPYSKKGHQELYKHINNVREDIKFNDLTDYIPRSNWKRYFNSSVDCEDQEFEKKWSRLYELRCLIAHNNFFSKNDYNEVSTLCNEINTIINDAIGIVKNVEIPKTEVEGVAENLAKNTSEVVTEFFEGYDLLRSKLLEYLHLRGDLNEDEIEHAVERIAKGDTVPKRLGFPSGKEVNAVFLTRKHLIGNSNLTPKDDTLLRYNQSIHEIIELISKEICNLSSSEP